MVTGFIIGVAITIIVGQLPKILGVPSLEGSLPEQLAQLVSQLPDTNPYTLAVGVFSLALILVLRVVSRRIPGPLIALVVGILAVLLFNLGAHGVSTVGEVATGLPMPSIPSVPLTSLPYLALGAAGIVFLAVGESVGAGRAYAAQRGYTIDADQEMIALGGANLASGLFGGFAADASLSQTATAEAAGAKFQVSSLVTAGLILATILLLAPLFENLPDAVLGAIVIAATIGLIDISEMRRYWRWRRADFALAMTAMVGVLTHERAHRHDRGGPAVRAPAAVQGQPAVRGGPGRMPGRAAGFGDVARHTDAEAVDGLVIVRLDAPLYFFNANVAKTQILDIVLAEEPAPAGILVDLAATADLDVTTTPAQAAGGPARLGSPPDQEFAAAKARLIG